MCSYAYMRKHVLTQAPDILEGRPTIIPKPHTLFEAAPVAVRPIMNANEAADYLRVSLRTLWTLVRDGRIKARRLRGRTLFRRPDLDAALN